MSVSITLSVVITPVMFTPLHKEVINALFISDVHAKFKGPELESLIIPVINKKEIDILFVGGDIANFYHKKGSESMPSSKHKCYEDTFFEALSKVDIPILWIPGNHDNLKSYSGGLTITKNDLNVHETVVRIADDLYVAGLGGSVPACDNYGNTVWNGYPIEEGDYNIHPIQRLITDIPDSSSVILFFHCGPSVALTTIAYNKEDGKQIFTGSKQLTSLVNYSLKRYNVPVVLHGHTHGCMGSTVYHRRDGQTRILCSGSFREYDATTFTLCRKGDTWMLAKQELFNLQYFI